MKLHLVRHGHYPLLNQALGGRAPHALSPLGQAQAAALARVFAQRPIAAVIASPVTRAMQTAAPIADRLGLPVEPDECFSEIEFAGWTGKGFAELAPDPAWQAWNTFRCTAGIPGGETILQVQARAIAGILAVSGSGSGLEAIIVTHADVIKVILAHFMGASLDLIRRMEIAPASISQVELWPNDARITAVNYPVDGMSDRNAWISHTCLLA